MNEDAMFYHHLDHDDNPPNQIGDCPQCGAIEVEIEYAHWLESWRCVESFPCEIVAELEQVKEPALVEMY